MPRWFEAPVRCHESKTDWSPSKFQIPTTSKHCQQQLHELVHAPAPRSKSAPRPFFVPPPLVTAACPSAAHSTHAGGELRCCPNLRLPTQGPARSTDYVSVSKSQGAEPAHALKAMVRVGRSAVRTAQRMGNGMDGRPRCGCFTEWRCICVACIVAWVLCERVGLVDAAK